MSKKKSCSCGGACGIDVNKEKQEYENKKNANHTNEKIANENTDENKQVVDKNILEKSDNNILHKNDTNCCCGETFDCKKELAPVEVDKNYCCTKNQKNKKKNWFLRHKKLMRLIKY